VSPNISHAFLNIQFVFYTVFPSISRHKFVGNAKVRSKQPEVTFDCEGTLNNIRTQTLRPQCEKAVTPTYDMASCAMVAGTAVTNYMSADQSM
jgi:hypothetical protein